MPETTCYHKHLMYNAGIVVAAGDIVAIGDSDAMVRDGFVRSITDAFDALGSVVVHLDQFRNNRRDLYPFCFPSFAAVTGAGCANYENGTTTGLRDTVDPLHRRNYGAFMCARRSDLIAIGGADEHANYTGHICGPYEMTFRLVNAGHREIWLENEFTYHTWHPGQAGGGNLLGPHDGRHMSTTALSALVTGRVLPLVENPVVRLMREGEPASEHVLRCLIAPDRVQYWCDAFKPPTGSATYAGVVQSYRGAHIVQEGERFRYCWPSTGNSRCEGPSTDNRTYTSAAEAKAAVDASFTPGERAVIKASAFAARIAHFLKLAHLGMFKRKLPLHQILSQQGTDRITRGLEEGASFSDGVAGLVGCLLRLPRTSEARSVIVAEAAEAAVIYWLVRFRVLSRVRVLRVGSTLMAAEAVNAVGTSSLTAIVSATAYTRFHQVLSSLPRPALTVA
jgi:hypothetical protein